MLIEIVLLSIMAVTFCVSVGVMVAMLIRQYKQIERLQDRLMARSYGEYVSTQQPQGTPTEPSRKPISWYDDVSLDNDEEKQ